MNDIFEYPPVKVKVWGDLACFTRPDMKVERMSYRVMTPSAARGILEAIFWKPEVKWVIREIHVLKPIRHISLRRNELKNKIPYKSITSWMKNEEHNRCVIERDRTQRNTLALRDVAYIIKANILLSKHVKNEHPAKYRDQFRRRVNRGSCYHRPYLGCKEFAAYFGPAEDKDTPISLSDDLGRMLFDLNYQKNNGIATPCFFNACLENGVLKVPLDKYQELWGM